MYLAGEPLIRHCSLNTQGASFFSKNMGISMYKHVKSCTNMCSAGFDERASPYQVSMPVILLRRACEFAEEQKRNKNLCPKTVTFCDFL